MSVFLGIDVGTSGTKTLAMRKDGRILATATVEYPLSSPRPGWSEQNPEHWWQATIKSVRSVLKGGKIKPADVAGIRKVAVRETPSTVTVTVTTGPEVHAKCGPGVDLLIGTFPVEAKLKAPLGSRRLIDGAP